jgi:ABC-type transport system involved in cytochrome bd biosynthesis fused ATPase/permease subunit
MDTTDELKFSFDHADRLLWIAVGLAVIFLGVLIVDFFLRRRRLNRHSWNQRESLRAQLAGVVRAARELRQNFRQRRRQNQALKRPRPRPPAPVR